MAAKRKTKFAPAHAQAYGLEVASRDPETGDVTSVACRFCVAFGREQKVGQKRKPRSTTKYFTPPYRCELYRQHLKGQHPSRWAQYAASSEDARQKFFDPAVATDISAALGNCFKRDELFFFIHEDIVNTILRGLLFHADDSPTTIERAMQMFECVTAEGAVVEGGRSFNNNEDCAAYRRVRVRQGKLFRLVMGYMSFGASFRLVSRQLLCTREVLGLGYLHGCSEKKVSQYARIALAANLQKLREILSTCWTFSIAFDSATIESTSYFDVRVRFGRRGQIFCFHLAALPMYGRHTGELMSDLFCKAMDVVCPTWRSKLLSAASDGARNMTGRVRGVVSRVASELTPSTMRLIRVWCGAHQLDLIFQKEIVQLCDSAFYGTLTSVIAYLRRQYNFINTIRSKCPKVATTRWLSLGKVLRWLTANRSKVYQYFEAKDPTCKPPLCWWIVVLTLADIVADVDRLFKSLQASTLLIQQQLGAFNKFVVALRERTGLAGPLTDSQLASMPRDSDVYVSGRMLISHDSVLSYMRGRGNFVYQHLSVLSDQSTSDIASSIGKLIVNMADGVSSIRPQPDDMHDPHNATLPCLPRSFAKMDEVDFVELVIRMRSRLESKFHESTIEDLELEHRELRHAYRHESALKRIIDSQDEHTSFSTGWGGGLCAKFPLLCEFGGGLASIYPGTSRVESDFSVLGWEKDTHRAALMDISLEGIMHAKQWQALANISTE